MVGLEKGDTDAPFSGMFPEDSLKEINRLLLRRTADYLAPARMLVSAFFGALYETLRIIFREPPNYFSLILMYAAALWGCSKKGRRPGQIWGPALMIILASMLGVDYGWKGVALFLMLYAVQGSRAGIAAVMISYMLFWGSFYNVTSELFGKKINLALLPDSISGPVRSLLRSETYSLAGLPLILIQFPQILTLPYWASWILCPSCPGYLSVPLNFRMPKWLGYLLYPGHLVLLIVLKVIQFGWFA